MLFNSLLAPIQSQDWTTNPAILAWISVASLIVGVLGIVIGFGVGYWFYRKSRNWHRVIYDVISDTPIVSVREQIGRGKIKVTYETSGGESEELNDARLLTLQVRNGGNGDVIIWSPMDKVKANMEVPIEFEFGGRRVVGLTHLETNPLGMVIQQENIDAYLSSPSPTQESLGLPSCILKQGQSIQLGILLNGPSGNIKLKAGKLLNGEVLDIHVLERRSSLRTLILIILIILIILAILWIFHIIQFLIYNFIIPYGP